MFSTIGYKNVRQFGIRYMLHRRNNSTLLIKARHKFAALGDGSVSLQKDDETGIATVTLKHQEKKNALSGSMMVQLADIAEDLSSWMAGKGLIFQAEGDLFCSGGDLSTVKAISNPEDGLLMSTFMHDTLTKIYRSPLVTVCLVHGKALGGGAELTTVTDYRIFTETGEVCFVQGRMGVVTGWGGGTRLVKLLGATKALELMTTCQKMDASYASKIGYADDVVESSNRFEAAKTWLSHRLTHDPEVIQALKKIVVGARDLSFEESLLNERRNFSPLWGGPANIKALTSNVKHK